VRVQSLRDIRAFRQLEDAVVVNNSGADVAAAQWNDPAPPAMSHQMVCRPRACGPACVHVIAKFFSPIVAVPIFHAGEPRPDRVDRMLIVRPVMSELSCEQRRASARVDQPPRANCFARIEIYRLSARAVQLYLRNFRWSQ